MCYLLGDAGCDVDVTRRWCKKSGGFALVVGGGGVDTSDGGGMAVCLVW